MPFEQLDRDVKQGGGPSSRIGHPQRRALRVLQSDGLGHQFAHYHQDEGDQGEGDHAAHRYAADGLGGAFSGFAQQRA